MPIDQQRHEQRPEPPSAVPPEMRMQEDQHEGADDLGDHVPHRGADRGSVEKTASFRPGSSLGVELQLVGEPGEHGADEGAEELADEVEQRLRRR